jgi:hypothetical protein
MYAEVRADGTRHHAALRVLAQRIGVDPATVERTLNRAQPNGRERALQPTKGTFHA